MMPYLSHEYLTWLKSSDPAAFEAAVEAHTIFGIHPETGDVLYIPDKDRFAGTYVIGVQGSGKSGFLENLIWSDAQKGYAIVVIDPHGDLTRNCLAHLPYHRQGDVYVLDMTDEDFP